MALGSKAPGPAASGCSTPAASTEICYIFYLDCVGILLHICLFWKVHFTAVIMPKILGLIGTHFIGVIFFFFFFFKNILILFSVSSSQRRVRQRTEEGIAASKARIANKLVIPEMNVVRAGVVVAPLDVINDIIQTYNWGYLYNCACIVLTRLVREFYTHLEVVQDKNGGIFLQSIV
jgi:hypothetical protein